jgi:hypothetical protein
VIYGLYGCLVAAGAAVAHRVRRRRPQSEAARGA